jgi:branched-chain amino acid transport system ATP-binding protein
MTRFAASLANAGYGRLKVLGAMNIAAESGQMLVVLGSNGAGKTTALKAVMGTVASEGRRLTLDGADLGALPSWRLPLRGVVLVPDGARCFQNLSILDNLRGARLALTGADRKPVEELLEQVFGFFPFLRQRSASIAGTLSGGQRQMLAIGRALMGEPRALLLDEPSAGLAPKIVEELFESLAEIKRRQGCAIVMAEQNVGYATQVADHCIVLEEGRVALAGPMAEVVQHERLRTAYLGL